MKQIQRVIFVVSILSVISTVTAARAKIAFAATPAMQLLASLETPHKYALLSGKNIITCCHTRLTAPNQIPNIMPGQHLPATVQPGVTPVSPALTTLSDDLFNSHPGSGAAFTTDAADHFALRTLPNEKDNLSAIDLRASNQSLLCRLPLTTFMAGFMKEFKG